MMDDTTVAQRVAEQLTVTRVGLGYDLEFAATSAGLAAERLAEAETGEIVLSETELDRLATVYGVDVTAFFGGRVTPYNYLAGA